MKTITGDLIQEAQDGTFDVIVYGCNCFCTMDSGVAKQIKDAFPEAYEADLGTTCGDKNKLGTISIATVKRGDRTLTIVNGYTQYDYRGKLLLVDYEAISLVMKAIREQFRGKKIGYPKIGAGLGGGDWNIILNIIDDELTGLDHTLVMYRG